MRVTMFLSWKPSFTSLIYCVAALMSVDNKFWNPGWVGSHKVWKDRPVSVSKDRLRYITAWSELGPWPKGRMLALIVAVSIPGVPQIWSILCWPH